MLVSRTKDESLRPLGTKDRLGQSLDFSKPAPIDIKHHDSTLGTVQDDTGNT
jgi:hypothetical protein